MGDMSYTLRCCVIMIAAPSLLYCSGTLVCVSVWVCSQTIRLRWSTMPLGLCTNLALLYLLQVSVHGRNTCSILHYMGQQRVLIAVGRLLS